MKVTRSWAVKHRPRKWSDIVGQEESLLALQGMLKRKDVPGAILFHGPSGCGKTTLARLFGRYLNCETNSACGKCASCTANPDQHPDVTELNAAEKRGIDDVRDLIAKSKFAPRHNMRIILLDEAHQLTPHALETLLKALEEPAASTLWMICTTDPQAFKDTFLMRCAKIEVGFAEREAMLARLKVISKREKIEPDVKLLKACVEASQGHAREAVSLFQQATNIIAAGGTPDRAIKSITKATSAEATAVATKLMLGLLGRSSKLVAKAALEMPDAFSTINTCLYFNQYLIGCEVQYEGRNLWHSPDNRTFRKLMQDKLGDKLNLTTMIRAQRKLTTLRGILHTVAGPEIGLVITHLTGD